MPSAVFSWATALTHCLWPTDHYLGYIVHPSPTREGGGAVTAKKGKRDVLYAVFACHSTLTKFTTAANLHGTQGRLDEVNEVARIDGPLPGLHVFAKKIEDVVFVEEDKVHLAGDSVGIWGVGA